jgi:large subunit ribosomal protein L32
MAKHPVPKYKTPKRKTKRRYSAFARGVRVKLEGVVNLIECPGCKQKMMNHHACPNCGKYKGRQVIDMSKEVDKITKVKA